MNTPIEIHLNGDVTQLAQPGSLADLLDELNVDLRSVAIELNQAIIPKSSLHATPLNSGDSVEIVEFIGGG